MAVKGVSETLLIASKIRIKKDRVEFMRQNASDAMRWIIHCAYHPAAISLLPKGTPPFKECPDMETFGNLYHRIQELQYYFKGSRYDKMPDEQRQNLFISLLESVHPDDARLLCKVKDKIIPYPYMTYAFMKECFPNWLPDRDENTWKVEGVNNDDPE